MTIYNILELFLFFVLFIELGTKKTKQYQKRFFWIGAIPLIIILGFRNIDVGGDTPGYCDFYMGKASGFYGSMFDKDNETEIGFIYLCRLIHIFCSDWRWFIFATSVISLLPFLLFVKNESQTKTFSYLSFLLPWGLLFLIQTPLRQDMAISLFLLGGYLIVNDGITNFNDNIKKKFIGLVFIIWGFLTHTTMYIVAPLVILLYFIPLNKKYSIIFVLITFVVSLTVRSLFTYIYDYFFLLTASMDSFRNINQYYGNNNYEIAETIKLGAVAPRTLFTIFVVLLSSIRQTNKFNYKCLVIGCCIMNIGISFPLASRIALIFILVGSSFVPQNFSLKKENNITLNYSKVLTVVLFILIGYKHYELCSNFIKTINSDILPYTFWFEH